MSNRKFYRTVYTVEVLSEEPVGEMSLADLDYEITEGHSSGRFLSTENEEVDGKKMAELLKAQGTDPEFFQLNDEGEDI